MTWTARFLTAVIVLVGWSAAVVDFWCWREAAGLPFTVSAKEHFVALDRCEMVTLYISLVMLLFGLLLTRRAPLRTKLIVISGPVVNIIVFSASLIEFTFALGSARIT